MVQLEQESLVLFMRTDRLDVKNFNLEVTFAKKQDLLQICQLNDIKTIILKQNNQ
jgi:hypothetical protein